MHDPLTVAFKIPNPFARRYSWKSAKWKDRPAILTIWHKDPERGGSDDSCDWFGSARNLNAREREVLRCVRDLAQTLDNRPHYPDSREHKAYQELKDAVRAWRARSRWRLPVRWHVWHWRLQVHPWQAVKRGLFDRCAACRKGFRFGESVTGEWNGRRIWHEGCEPGRIARAALPKDGGK